MHTLPVTRSFVRIDTLAALLGFMASLPTWLEGAAARLRMLQDARDGRQTDKLTQLSALYARLHAASTSSSSVRTATVGRLLEDSARLRATSADSVHTAPGSSRTGPESTGTVARQDARDGRQTDKLTQLNALYARLHAASTSSSSVRTATVGRLLEDEARFRATSARQNP